MTGETTDAPAPRFERFGITYPNGLMVMAYYCGGATLREAQVSHPSATVEAVEASSCGSAV